MGGKYTRTFKNFKEIPPERKRKDSPSDEMVSVKVVFRETLRRQTLDVINSEYPEGFCLEILNPDQKRTKIEAERLEKKLASLEK